MALRPSAPWVVGVRSRSGVGGVYGDCCICTGLLASCAPLWREDDKMRPLFRMARVQILMGALWLGATGPSVASGGDDDRVGACGASQAQYAYAIDSLSSEVTAK